MWETIYKVRKSGFEIFMASQKERPRSILKKIVPKLISFNEGMVF